MPRHIRLYDSFRAIAQMGGITAASKSLCKAPSAVHHDLAALEKLMGRKLFERAGRRLILTSDGRILFEVVSRLLDDFESVEARLIAGLEKMPLRIAAVSGFGRYRLAPTLMKMLPSDRCLSLFFGTHDEVVEAVRAERSDIAITYRPVSSAPLHSCRIATEKLVLLASSEASINMNFNEMTFITYDEFDYVFSRWFDVSQVVPQRLRRLDHYSELEEALMAVSLGRGVTIVPADAWLGSTLKSQLKSVMHEVVCENNLYAIYVAPEMVAADIALIESCFN
jgi:DNA-binding transcriptional LysR family regulator